MRQQRAKDRQRAQRIAQKTEAAARERARHRALVAARAASPARPRPASVPPRRASRKKPGPRRAPRRRASPTSPRRCGGSAPTSPTRATRTCARCTTAAAARRRARRRPSARRAASRRARAAALRPPDPPDVAFGRRNDRPPASPLRGREDRATRRARSKRVARAARDSVDLLERLMGPASPESPTPAIDRAAAAALRRDPLTTRAASTATSPRRPCSRARRSTPRIRSDPLVADEVEALLAGGVGAADADDAILAGGADIDAISAGSPVEGDDDLSRGLNIPRVGVAARALLRAGPGARGRVASLRDGALAPSRAAFVTTGWLSASVRRLRRRRQAPVGVVRQAPDDEERERAGEDGHGDDAARRGVRRGALLAAARGALGDRYLNVVAGSLSTTSRAHASVDENS